MNLYSRLTGDALELARKHQRVLDRLPRTFLVSNLIQLEKWPDCFEPEKVYFRAVFDQLDALSPNEFQEMFGSLQNFELKTGCDQIPPGVPEEVQSALLAHLQRQGQYAAWRAEIDKIFVKLGPMVEARLFAGPSEPRLVVLLYGEGIAIERNQLWQRFRKDGVRIPLNLDGAETQEAFLRTLFTGRSSEKSDADAPTLFQIVSESQNATPLDSWIIEAGDSLHKLCEQSGARNRGTRCAVGMSYDRLRAYRDQLTETLYAKVRAGIKSPLEMAAYVKTLKINPQEGVSLYLNDPVLTFIRDTFLAGNGTLIINNTFVEWASVQALKRAQPRLLAARFGVRDKMKPFSSLLLFSKPRATDQIPIMQDPLGSFVDAELLAYYIWLNAENISPYRGKTLYLLLAEGVDEMLALAPGTGSRTGVDLPRATLADVGVTMAQWLKVQLPGSSGRAIPQLAS